MRGQTQRLPERGMELGKIAVAVSTSEKTSRRAVKWALKHLISSSETDKVLMLVHVRQPVEFKKTVAGEDVHISKLSVEVQKSLLRESHLNTQDLMNNYTKLCTTQKVNANILVLESKFVGEALVKAISEYQITKLVLGAPSQSLFHKAKGERVAHYLCENAPEFCKIYLSNQKSESTGSLRRTLESSSSLPSSLSRHDSPNKPSRMLGSSKSVPSSASSTQELGSSMHSQRSSISSISSIDESESLELYNSSSRGSHDRDEYFSASPSLSDGSRFADRAMSGQGSPLPSFVQDTNSPDLACGDQNFPCQLDHLRISTRYQQRNEELYPYVNKAKKVSDYRSNALRRFSDQTLRYDHPSAPPFKEGWSCGSTSQPVRSTNELPGSANLPLEETSKYAEIPSLYLDRAEEETISAMPVRDYAAPQLFDKNPLYLKTFQALEMAKQRAREENLKLEKAQKEVELAMKRAEEERQLQKEAEFQSIQDEEQRIAVVQALERVRQEYRIYSFEQISTATDNFCEANILGEGGYGIVYKGKLHHTDVAIKVLKDNASQGLPQYEHEVAVLGRLHHPHMVLLLGCCPEKGCLVYEYMANGSLEDRLECVDGTPPIPWYTRFRIASEISLALLFLHGSKPEPIIHRDLKPGNILLDRNFVSKIGDVGLATLIPELLAASNSTYLLESKPLGSVAYIDPEYYQSGFFGAKSDIYALGVVLLRLLTGKPAVGLQRYMKEAIDTRSFATALDRSAGEWPLEEAFDVATLALSCMAISRHERPDLETYIIPILQRAAKLGEITAMYINKQPDQTDQDIPEIFLCPILQEVMEDPVVAADGYTYERVAILQWLTDHNTSPLINLPLAHNNLISNVSLKMAIAKWKQENGHILAREEWYG